MESSEEYYDYSIEPIPMFGLNLYIPKESNKLSLIELPSNIHTNLLVNVINYLSKIKKCNVIIFKREGYKSLKLNYNIKKGFGIVSPIFNILSLQIKPYYGEILFNLNSVHKFSVDKFNDYTIWLYNYDLNNYIYNKDTELIGINLLLNSIKLEFDNYKEFIINHPNPIL